MEPEPGDDLDCPYCDAVHELRQAKEVRVQGFERRVRSGLYADCPEVGYLAVTEGGEVEPLGDVDDGRDDDGRDDWP